MQPLQIPDVFESWDRYARQQTKIKDLVYGILFCPSNKEKLLQLRDAANTRA